MTEATIDSRKQSDLNRGIRATEAALREIERLVRRDVKRMRKQLRELQRSADAGKPTEYVKRFGAARRISDGGLNELKASKLAVELADDVLFDYYQSALHIDVWPLLALANGLYTDTLESHARMLCHSGSIELGNKFERKLCESLGLKYERVEVTRHEPTLDLPKDDDGVRHAG